MKLMAGIDLHSNNLVCGIVDQNGKRIQAKRLSCDLQNVLNFLSPYKEEMETIVVESTYNWYWLVDGLMDHGYNTVLANPAGMKQYNGLKHTDDESDAFFLAEMSRLGILPTGYIFPKKLRPVRDMLRRRARLVSHRTALLLSIKSLYARTRGSTLSLGELKGAEADEVKKWFSHPADQDVSRIQMSIIETLDKGINEIEKAVLAVKDLLPAYPILSSMPGVGKILALTISLETGEISRFSGPGDYSSYCRCVDTSRKSNGKNKGENNSKCGNKYLGWAYVEAANFARRYDDLARRFFDKKKAKTNGIVATKALACKLSKAAWHMMSKNEVFNHALIYGQNPEAIEK